MAQLPPFSFPLRQEDECEDRHGVNVSRPLTDSTADPKAKPRIHLQTCSTPNQIPGSQLPHSQALGMSPPDSPTRGRVHASSMQHLNGTITPPYTPAYVSHSKSSSASSIANSLSSLRRGNSTSSHTSFRGRGASITEDFENSLRIGEEEAGSKVMKVFPYWVSDYEIKDQDKKKPLGSGLWSDVYLATPCLPKDTETTMSALVSMSVLTPPITPVSYRSSIVKSGILDLPRAYAIKQPASKAAKAVLRAEASIISYLSRFSESTKYVVQFFGLDTRNEALVLKAMDTTLESFVEKELNLLGEPDRAQELKIAFPSLAKGLVEGLEWLGDRGIAHADIKPGNILVTTSSSKISVVYSDFSSSLFLTTSHSSPSPAPLGGGTWDFLDPLLLSTSAPASPSPRSDLWSLATTLLFVVTGASPFDAAGSNIFRRREMVKQGTPLSYVGYGDSGVTNMMRLRGLGRDTERWFGLVLRKDAAKRSDVRAWRVSLETLYSP